MRSKAFALAMIGASIGLALAQRAARAEQQPAPAQPGAPASGSGLDLAALDRTADACGNFYQFACGGWLAQHPLPADQSNYGRFHELQERNNEILHQVLEKASSAPTDADTRKIGDYYGSCMDETAIASKGLTPLDEDFKRIGSIATAADLPVVLAALHSKGTNVFFSFGSSPDFKDAAAVIAVVDQGGLGLPDRDYYLEDDANSQKLRQEYVAHVGRMLQLAGDPAAQADAEAQAVMRIETALAKSALDRVSRRAPANVYHKMTTAELRALTPAFDWTAYLRDLQVPAAGAINVSQPEFMKGMNTILTSTPVADVKTYLRWQTLNGNANFLPKTFIDESFAFTKVLTGAREQRPRWKRCVDYTDGDLGEVVGKAFIAQAFGAEGKTRTLEMVKAIEHAMDKDIQETAWMSPETRAQAAAKLKAVANKIGYPDRWRDYSTLRIVRGDALGNSQRANVFELHRQLAKIGKPVDKSEWGMTPPTVNAYYNPLENNIN
ncbi:MAG: M13 family metallopeptidase, partial [Acidobacteriota bacterium]